MGDLGEQNKRTAFFDRVETSNAMLLVNSTVLTASSSQERYDDDRISYKYEKIRYSSEKTSLNAVDNIKLRL